MIGSGIWSMRQTKGADDFFLGGRGLSAPVAAMSAQASDMSGWLLMGLPGSVYALGTGQAWIAVGLGLGTKETDTKDGKHFEPEVYVWTELFKTWVEKNI